MSWGNSHFLEHKGLCVARLIALAFSLTLVGSTVHAQHRAFQFGPRECHAVLRSSSASPAIWRLKHPARLEARTASAEAKHKLRVIDGDG
jgi:hypothetical protein